MFIQATTPRPVFDVTKHPKHIFVHTLAKIGTSQGQVFFNATTDPEHGKREGKALDPVHHFPIEGEEGFEALAYVIPFWELFQPTASAKKLTYDGAPIEDQAGVSVGNMKLVRYCTAGFGITIKSAFRANTREYGESITAFTVVCPVSGGGILRIADSPFDLNNASFDPYAPDPDPRKDLTFSQMYSRNHKLISSSALDRRNARIASAEASIRSQRLADTDALPADRKPKLLGRG